VHRLEKLAELLIQRSHQVEIAQRGGQCRQDVLIARMADDLVPIDALRARQESKLVGCGPCLQPLGQDAGNQLRRIGR
jgi:hypothetical protein